MSGVDHDRRLAEAFDGQAPKFERAPVQTDPNALARLVRFAGFPDNSRILDAGCGPGLVSEVFLEAGCRMVGVDLSHEMIGRAQTRCARFGDRAEFHQASLFDTRIESLAPYDGAISRYVLHHVVDSIAFINRQVELLRRGGLLVLSDHLTDPVPELARRHEEIERFRDVSHTASLTSGQIVDLFARAGLCDLALIEESFTLDFDEWFDRGTPSQSKESVREVLLKSPSIRGFSANKLADGSTRIDCVRAIVRGVKP